MKLNEKLIKKAEKNVEEGRKKLEETVNKWSMSHFNDGRDTNMYRYELLEDVCSCLIILKDEEAAKEWREAFLRDSINKLDERMDRAMNFRGAVFSNGTGKMEYLGRLCEVQNGLEEMLEGSFEYKPRKQAKGSDTKQPEMSSEKVAEQRQLLEAMLEDK